MATIDQKIQTEWVVGPVLNALVCAICEMILHDPVQTPCEHVFCRDCMEDFIQKSKNPTCPIDREPMAKQEWQRPALYLRQMLQEMKVRCPEPKCEKVVQVDAFQGHRKACRLEKIRCEKGCGTELARKDFPNHDCIKELRDTVEDLRQQFSQHRVADEVKCQWELVEGMKLSRDEMAKTQARMNEVLRQLRSPQGTNVALVTSQKNQEHTGTVYPRSSGTFFINEKGLTGARVESSIQDIGGVEWQVFLTKSNCFLKCHGPANITSNNWKIISDINFVPMNKDKESSGDEVILRDEVVSAENPIIGFPWLNLTWPGVEGTRLEFYVLFDRTTTHDEEDRLKEKVFLHDFSPISALKKAGDVLVSTDLVFLGLTWNLVLKKPSSGSFFNLHLVCNRNVEEDWGTCSVEYNLMFKTRRGTSGDQQSGWKSHEFSHLSLLPPDFCQLVGSTNPFIVNDTLSTTAHVKILNFRPGKFAGGVRDNV